MDIFSLRRLQSFQAPVGAVPKDFTLKDTTYFEHKEDGRRLTIYNHPDKPIAIYRKEMNVWPDISRNKDIMLALKNIPYGTVVDGEALPGEGNFLASDTIRDIKKGRATYKVFNIPYLAGENTNLSGLALAKELQRLGADTPTPIVKTLAGILADELDNDVNAPLKDFESFEGMPLESLKGYLLRYIRGLGIEGLVIRDQKSLEAYKYKQAKTVTCVVTRKRRGDISGKYFLTLGSLELSMFNKKGKLTPVGKCGGFSEIQRDEIWEMNVSDMDPVEIEYDSLTTKTKLRFAQFKGFRSDRTKESCTLDKLLD